LLFSGTFAQRQLAGSLKNGSLTVMLLWALVGGRAYCAWVCPYHLVAEWADALQIGTRNMQNFELLKEVGQARKPVLLKRGMSATVEEWLMAAEYVAQRGNSEIVLCERGIRTFEPSTRNTLDLGGMIVARNETHLPVVVDPSHATGKKELVAPMARAAVAAGADGVMVDVHPRPDEALCDGPQALTPSELGALGNELGALAAALGRVLGGGS